MAQNFLYLLAFLIRSDHNPTSFSPALLLHAHKFFISTTQTASTHFPKAQSDPANMPMLFTTIFARHHHCCCYVLLLAEVFLTAVKIKHCCCSKSMLSTLQLSQTWHSQMWSSQIWPSKQLQRVLRVLRQAAQQQLLPTSPLLPAAPPPPSANLLRQRQDPVHSSLQKSRRLAQDTRWVFLLLSHAKGCSPCPK